jgi:hypothetical protein
MKKNLFTLILIIIIFAAPLLIAWVAYQGQWLHRSTNKGELITPPIALETLNLHFNTENQTESNTRQWLMLYVVPAQEDPINTQPLHNLMQMHKALGKEQPRVARLLLFTQANTLNEFASLQAKYSGTRMAIIQDNIAALESGTYYIADPLGNIILRYSSNLPVESLHKDLQRLLKASRIG